MTTHDTPRIYVACLASYNAGRLHGEWIDATDVDEMRKGVAKMLERSPIAGAEEYAIHDYDGFAGMDLGEYEDLGTVAQLGAALEEHGPAFAAYAANVGTEYAVESFEEAYQGEHASERDFAYQLADEIGFEPAAGWPSSYIDWEAAARDLFMGDYFSADAPGGVWVFRSL